MQKARKPAKKKSRSVAHMKKKQPKALIRTNNRFRVAIIVALLTGLVGVYLVFRANAANDQPGQVYLGSTQQTTKHQSGETFTLTLYANPYNISGASALYLAVNLDSVASQVTRQGSAVCNPSSASGVTCSSGVYPASPSGGTFTDRDANFCVRFDPSAFGRVGVAVLAVTYTTQKASPYNFGSNYSWSTGSSCTTNGFISGHGFTSGAKGFVVGVEGSTPGGCTGSCGGDENPGGRDPGGRDNGDEGDGDGNSGGDGQGANGGAGGSGGGSSANKQGGRNILPNSSNQGSKKQNKIEPSPFYDGKQYAPGSDAIDKAFGNISVAGRSIAHGWLYLAAITVTVAGVASYYWGWRQDSPIRKLIKR